MTEKLWHPNVEHMTLEERKCQALASIARETTFGKKTIQVESIRRVMSWMGLFPDSLPPYIIDMVGLEGAKKEA